MSYNKRVLFLLVLENNLSKLLGEVAVFLFHHIVDKRVDFLSDLVITLEIIVVLIQLKREREREKMKNENNGKEKEKKKKKKRKRKKNKPSFSRC
jgi:ATP/ADP translocase